MTSIFLGRWRVQGAFSRKISKVNVDPILRKTTLPKSRGLSEDRLTILNNKIMANMDAMSENEAVYSAFDDLMPRTRKPRALFSEHTPKP